MNDGNNGRYVGEQITVVDANGARGPATVTFVEEGGFQVRPDFDYTTTDGAAWLRTSDQSWYFFSSETSDYGLTLIFEPYSNPAAPQPAGPFGIIIITFRGEPVQDMTRERLLEVVQHLAEVAYPDAFRVAA